MGPAARGNLKLIKGGANGENGRDGKGISRGRSGVAAHSDRMGR